MNIIRIGSSALQYHIPSIKVGKDIDLIMTYEDYQIFRDSFKSAPCDEHLIAHYPISNGKKFVIKTSENIYEIEIAWPNSTAEEFMRLVINDPNTPRFSKWGDVEYYPSINALYALKMSHRFLRNSPHFLKTMQHIHLMRGYGSQISEYYSEWYKKREKETYDYGHPDLTVKKQDFFQEETFYKYDHDHCHEAIKLSEVPAYTRILMEGFDVKCSKEKFDALSYEHKMYCALEESYVLALERMIIPNDFIPSPKLAFRLALMKVCTSITSGWFRDWCYENYYAIDALYNGIYVDKFKSALDAGKVRPFSHDRKY